MPTPHPRQSLAPQATTTSTSASRARQLSHLHAQLAQLSANLSDTENLMRMTAVQAGVLRGLGGWTGALFMASSKVLGEQAEEEASRTGATGGDETVTTAMNTTNATSLEDRK